jgi:hypothetical protein
MKTITEVTLWNYAEAGWIDTFASVGHKWAAHYTIQDQLSSGQDFYVMGRLTAVTLEGVVSALEEYLSEVLSE